MKNLRGTSQAPAGFFRKHEQIERCIHDRGGLCARQPVTKRHVVRDGIESCRSGQPRIERFIPQGIRPHHEDSTGEILHINMRLCNILCMRTTRTIAECLLAAQQAKFLGLTQENIANALGASQSQVSRVLSGQTKKHTGLAERVCNYVNSHLHGIPREAVANNDELMSALASVWDGSSQQAKLLANLIRSAGALMPSTGTRIETPPC